MLADDAGHLGTDRRAVVIAALVLLAWCPVPTPTPDTCVPVIPGSDYRPSPHSGGHWFDVDGRLYGWSEEEDGCIEPMTVSADTPAALLDLAGVEVPGE